MASARKMSGYFVKKQAARAPPPAKLRGNKKHQALLRREIAETDLCNSCSLSAASPLGSEVRPFSISLTDDAVRPMSEPICAKVIPFPRRSEMRDAHDVMSGSLRHPVDFSQRPPVTVFRDNLGMPKPVSLPKDLNTIGARVRAWREHRNLSRKDLAKRAGYSYTGLSDLELERSNGSGKLHLIAAVLRLNPHYLETGKGEPEAEFPQDPPPPADDFALAGTTRARLKRLNKIERAYIESKVLEALAEIESERRSKTG